MLIQGSGNAHGPAVSGNRSAQDGAGLAEKKSGVFPL